MLTFVNQYLCELALISEGAQNNIVAFIPCNAPRDLVLSLIRSLLQACRHDRSFTPDHQAFISLKDVRLQRARIMCTPAKLPAGVYDNPKARFQLSFPVYRVSGQGNRSFVVPAIGIRAFQCHSMRPDLGLSYLYAAQELLTVGGETALPVFGVHGVDIHAWYSLPIGSPTIIPGGLDRTRVAVYFVVSLPGDTGSFVFRFGVFSKWVADLHIFLIQGCGWKMATEPIGLQTMWTVAMKQVL